MEIYKMESKEQIKVNDEEYGDWEEGDLELLSETSLAESWLSPEDEKAFAYLQEENPKKQHK